MLFLAKMDIKFLLGSKCESFDFYPSIPTYIQGESYNFSVMFLIGSLLFHVEILNTEITNK